MATNRTSADRVRALGVMVDAVNFDQALERLAHWLADSDAACRFVVTPNLDHAVLLRTHSGLRAVYADASLIIADGMPMVWASRLNRGPLRERVTGSDLVPGLLAKHRGTEKLRVYLLGAAPGVAERAADNVHRQFPNVQVVGTVSPAYGFEHRADDCRELIAAVNEAAPHLLIVGLGAPKQELWLHKHAQALKVRVAICAGATIDFLAGERSRAPRLMQRTGTEWLYRALSEPRRLIPRYAKDMLHLPGLLYGDWKSRSASEPSAD